MIITRLTSPGRASWPTPNRLAANCTLDRAHHYLAGVGPDPRLDWHAALRPETPRVAPELFLHPQRRVERALGMVFMRNRRPEQREDAFPALG